MEAIKKANENKGSKYGVQKSVSDVMAALSICYKQSMICLKVGKKAALGEASQGQNPSFACAGSVISKKRQVTEDVSDEN